MRFAAVLTLGILIALPHNPLTTKTLAVFHPQDYWMGVYYGKTKIGYAHITSAYEETAGAGAYRKTIDFQTFCADSGQRLQAGHLYSLSAGADLMPVREVVRAEIRRDSKMTDTQHMEFSFGPKTKTTKITLNGQVLKESTTDYIGEDRKGSMQGCKYELGMLPLTVGLQTRLKHSFCVVTPGPQFNIIRDSGKIRVVRREKLSVGGHSFDTMVVVETGEFGKIVRWHLDNGDIVKEQMPEEKITLVRETKEKAREVEAGVWPDGAIFSKSGPGK